MEENRISIVVRELCYIYHKRNLLGRKRDSLRHKYRYLQDIKRSLQVRDNYKSSSLYQKVKKNPSIYIDLAREHYLRDNPIPKRFKDATLREMNMMLLQAQAEVCKIKIQVMKHTKKYEKRIRVLAPVPEYFRVQYVCGLVKTLAFYTNSDSEEWMYIVASDMERYHDIYVSDIAIDKMLSDK